MAVRSWLRCRGDGPSLGPSRSSLLLWLDATQVRGVNSGDPLPIWHDLSVNRLDMAQPVGANQPLWIDGIRNCKPIVRFNGTTSFYTHSAFPVLSGPRTYYVYGSPTFLAEETPIMGDGANWRIGYQIGGQQQNGWVDTGGAHTGGSYTSFFHILCFVFRGDNGGLVSREQQGSNQTFRDESLQPLFSATWTPAPTAGFCELGTHTQTDWLRADIGEILVYSQEHTAQQQAQVAGYLAAKWDRFC